MLARTALKSEKGKAMIVEIVRQGQAAGWDHNRVRLEIAEKVMRPIAVQMRETWLEEAEMKGLPVSSVPAEVSRDDRLKAAARAMRASPALLKC